MDERLCEAIRRRRLLRVTYGGEVRLVEPYLHGIRSPNTEILVCYQRSGGSKSGTRSGWKALHVAAIEAAEITDIAFVGDQETFNPTGSSYNITSVHCLVEVRHR